MSRDKKDIKEAINQLENLRFHCDEMSKNGEAEEWKEDTKALDLAIYVLKKELYSEKSDIITLKGAYIAYEPEWDDSLKEKYKNEAFLGVVNELRKSKAVIYTENEIASGITFMAELDVVKREV